LIHEDGFDVVVEVVTRHDPFGLIAFAQFCKESVAELASGSFERKFMGYCPLLYISLLNVKGESMVDGELAYKSRIIIGLFP
jgi:hypothetical protein